MINSLTTDEKWKNLSKEIEDILKKEKRKKCRDEKYNKQNKKPNRLKSRLETTEKRMNEIADRLIEIPQQEQQRERRLKKRRRRRKPQEHLGH